MPSNWQTLSLIPTRTNTDSSCSVLCRASTSRNVSQIKEVHVAENLGHAAAGRSRMTLFGIMACKIQSRLWVKTGKAQCEHMVSALRRWSQPVDATLYLKREMEWAGWVKDFIEGLLRQRKRSYGIAGSAESR